MLHLEAFVRGTYACIIYVNVGRVKMCMCVCVSVNSVKAIKVHVLSMYIKSVEIS